MADDVMTNSDRNRPNSLSDLFVSFNTLALQGFGGVMAVAQYELVEHKRWMTNEEFVEEVAVAQIMPGPNVVNLAMMFGARHFGVPGALAALAGMLAIPLLIVLLLAFAYAHYGSYPAVMGALRGMGAVAAGLIIAAGIKLIPTLKANALGAPLCSVFGLATFVAIGMLRWPLAYVLPGLGSLACLAAWLRLKP